MEKIKTNYIIALLKWKRISRTMRKNTGNV